MSEPGPFAAGAVQCSVQPPESSGETPDATEARGRAESITTALVPVDADAPPAGRQAEFAAGANKAFERAARWFAVISAGASLLHASPPSIADARERHHLAAGHHEGGLMRGSRLAYGYAHLGLKAVLHFIEWVTASPPVLIVAILAGVVFWIWS